MPIRLRFTLALLLNGLEKLRIKGARRCRPRTPILDPGTPPPLPRVRCEGKGGGVD
jgi:hypothetical protein